MSIQFLDVILLVKDCGHVGLCLSVLLLAPDAAAIVPAVSFTSEVKWKVYDPLLTIKILLLLKVLINSEYILEKLSSQVILIF